MANIVSQVKPSATTLTDLYQVTSGKSSIVSSIVVCNQSATATSFRISVAPAGAVDALSQYVYYDIPINGNDTFVSTIGFALNGITTQDKIRVYATLATLSFTCFAAES
jgi:hypothetical protein